MKPAFNRTTGVFLLPAALASRSVRAATGRAARFPGPRWARRVRAVARDAEPPGFGLPPRLVAAFGAHPALAHDYLRCATFEAWMVAADDPELAELPPLSPWPITGGARAPMLPIPLAQE
jgi:hypothetical protein